MLAYKKLLTKTLTALLSAVMLAFGTAAPALAASYNCGVYGAGTYQNNSCEGGGELVNTGQSIWLVLLAVLLILLGTYMIYRTRKKMKDHNLERPQSF